MPALRAVLAGCLFFAGAAGAQTPSLPTAAPLDTTVSALKSPTTARLLAIIPGVGHMYAGEVEDGFIVLALMGGIMGGGVLATGIVCFGKVFSTDTTDSSDCGRTPLTVTYIALGGFWLYSIFDAGRAAHRTNAKRAGRASLLLEPMRIQLPNGGDRAGVKLGLQISTW